MPIWFIMAVVAFWFLHKTGVWASIGEIIYKIIASRQDMQTRIITKALDQNEKLIDDLLAGHVAERNHYREIEAMFMRYLNDLVSAQARLTVIMERTKGFQEITSRDWSRINEILSDIDQLLHEIKGSVTTNHRKD